MSLRRLAFAAAMMLVAVGLMACTDGSRLVEHSKVVVLVTTPFTSANPASEIGQSSPTNADVAWLTSTGFGWRDEHGGVVLDESFGTATIVARDPLTVRYTLADGVRWSDGALIDASDLLLSWAVGSGAIPEAGFATTPSATLALVSQPPQLTADRRSIFLHFDRFTDEWPTAIAPGLAAHVVAGRAFTLPLDDEKQTAAAKAAVVAAIEHRDATTLAQLGTVWNDAFTVADVADASRFVASGPYRVTAVSAGSVTLAANLEYHGDRHPIIETIEVRVEPDPVKAAAALAAGDVDVVVPEATADAVAALGDLAGTQLVASAGAQLEQLQLQLAGSRNRVFGDARVREAFLHVVPRQRIVDQLVAPVWPAATVPDSFLVSPAAAGPSPSPSTPSTASEFAAPKPAAAATLLTAAGVSNPEVCILYDPADERRVSEFEFIQQSGDAAGFLVTDCSSPDWRRMLGRGGAYDAALLSWDSAAGANALAGLFRSDSGTNLNHFSDPTVDTLAGAGNGPKLLAGADAALFADAAGLPLFAHPTLVAVSDKLTGVSVSAFGGGVLWNAWDWQPR